MKSVVIGLVVALAVLTFVGAMDSPKPGVVAAETALPIVAP